MTKFHLREAWWFTVSKSRFACVYSPILLQLDLFRELKAVRCSHVSQISH